MDWTRNMGFAAILDGIASVKTFISSYPFALIDLLKMAEKGMGSSEHDENAIQEGRRRSLIVSINLNKNLDAKYVQAISSSCRSLTNGNSRISNPLADIP
jgi:predicted ATP-binding protein involved in virulence